MVWHPDIEWTGGGLINTSADLDRWGAELFEEIPCLKKLSPCSLIRDRSIPTRMTFFTGRE